MKLEIKKTARVLKQKITKMKIIWKNMEDPS